MAFSSMIDMRKTPADKAEEVAEMTSVTAVEQIADYPYGLCLSLTGEELEKLDLSDDCEVGDMIDLRAFAEVTSISKRKVNGVDECRIELQIQRMSVENEATEEAGA